MIINIVVLLLMLCSKNDQLVVSADTSFSFELQRGRGKFKIFEDQWSDLELSVIPQVPFSVFDEDHNLVAATDDGSVRLNTFRDYWLTVSFSGLDDLKLRIDLNRTNDYRRLISTPVQGELGPSQPAEVIEYVIPQDGRYRFELNSPDRGGDIDLNIYMDNYNLAGSGVSQTNHEQVSVDGFCQDTIKALIFLNDPQSRVRWELNVDQNDELTGISIGQADIYRMNYKQPRDIYLLDNTTSYPVLIYLNSSEDVDLDLIVEYQGEKYSSTSYSSMETVLIPPRTRDIKIVVEGYQLNETNPRYTLEAREIKNFYSFSTGHIQTQVDPKSREIIGIVNSSPGFKYFEVNSIEKRDVDMIIFNHYGVSDLSFSSLNPREVSVQWMDYGDTLFILPMLYDRSSPVDIIFREIDPDTLPRLTENMNLEDFVRPPYQGVKVYLLEFENRGTGVITVRGESHRERDVDLIVAGRDLHRRSEGEENPTDRASDETILFYVHPEQAYLAEVYAYGRGDRCRYQISSLLIEDQQLQYTSQPSIWALIVGISGYPGESALNRASQDALEFYQTVVESENVDPSQVVFLADERATRDNIIENLNRISTLAKQGDRIIFFFSGHGCQERYQQGELEEDGFDEGICGYPQPGNEDIFDDELNDLLPDNIEAWIFLDACHSGGFVKDLMNKNNRLIITASEEDREVGERVLTPILIRAIRGRADSNDDGYISARELMDYVGYYCLHTCPECLYEFSGSAPRTCPNCGTELTGSNRPMNPELDTNLDPHRKLFRIYSGGKN